jgi:hypothetical protein
MIAAVRDPIRASSGRHPTYALSAPSKGRTYNAICSDRQDLRREYLVDGTSNPCRLDVWLKTVDYFQY